MSEPPGSPPPAGGWPPPGPGWQPPSAPPPGPFAAPPPGYPLPPGYPPPPPAHYVPGGYPPPTGPYAASPQYPPPAPKTSRTAVLIVVAAVVVVAAVIVGAVLLTGGGDSPSTARAGAATAQPPGPGHPSAAGSTPAASTSASAQDVNAISRRMRTACTGALAKDMAALVPSHTPLHDPRDAGPEQGFQFAICSADQSVDRHPRVFRSLSAEITLFSTTTGSPGPNPGQCRAEVAITRNALAKIGHKLVKVPALGDVTVAATEHLSDAWVVDVVACRGGLEIRGSYRAFAIRGTPPDVNGLLQKDEQFVRRAFSDLGG